MRAYSWYPSQEAQPQAEGQSGTRPAQSSGKPAGRAASLGHLRAAVTEGTDPTKTFRERNERVTRPILRHLQGVKDRQRVHFVSAVKPYCAKDNKQLCVMLLMLLSWCGDTFNTDCKMLSCK